MGNILKNKPASWRTCLACEYWAGPRQLSKFGNAVEYASDLTQGVCWERGWQRARKTATSTCRKWWQWGVLN